MSKAKEISFSEFLKEDVFKNKASIGQSLAKTIVDARPPQLPKAVEADEEKTKVFWRTLRKFFRTGEKPKESSRKALLPVLLAPHFNNDDISTDYPFFLAEEEGAKNISLIDLLTHTFDDTFCEKEAPVLRANLPRLENYMRGYAAKKWSACSFKPIADKALQELKKLDVHGEEGKQFKEDITRFGLELPKSGTLINFSAQVSIHLLAYLLNNKFYQDRKLFVKEVSRLRSGLRDLLAVEKNKGPAGQNSKDMQQDYKFAASMIQFDKLNKLMPKGASVSMSETRLKRLQQTIQTLEKSEKLLLKQNAIIIIGKELHDNGNYNWKQLLSGTAVSAAAKGKICSAAGEAFDVHLHQLAQVIAATRIAQLELKDKFDEDIHSSYFAQFDYRSFTEAELAFCPPVILIETAENLLGRELSGFSKLLSSNKPIRVLAINKQIPFELNLNGSTKNDSFVFRQELAALAVAHRSAYTLQAATDNPDHMLTGMEEGIASASPALFHIMEPMMAKTNATQAYLRTSAAVESRQFPVFTYSDSRSGQWGSRFNINANPQPEHNWPEYEIDIIDSEKNKEKLQLAFTFADFFAIEPVNSDKLLVVLPGYWTEDLIPLSEYLNLSADELYTKVPFIWLIDGKNILHKVAVPYSLILTCKERLDFWNFIQELGGVNSFHVEQAVNSKKEELQEEKEKEIDALKAEHEKEIEQVRLETSGEAMDKLANILLDIDSIAVAPADKPVSAPAEEISEASQETETAEASPEPEEEALVSSEPWIDAVRCTTCNECTDKYPNMFKYNADKQAYIEDATAGTYLQMVQAAEECPAKCIHPGLPLNPNEPGVDELIKRAEPFN